MSESQPRTAGLTLFSAQRRQRIMDELQARGAVTVRAIAAQLGVSELTIRRDVNAMAGLGLLQRVHGGATLRNEPLPPAAHTVPGEPRFTIGMVVPSLDYYWPQIINGARTEADNRQARIVLRGSSYDAADNRRQLQRLVDSRTVHGLIAAPVTTGRDGGELLRWLNALPIPVVLAERRPPASIPAQKLEWVATDHAFGAGLAVRHLWKEGHRRIGVLAGHDSPTTQSVVHGWEQALMALGLPVADAVRESPDAAAMADGGAYFERILQQCRAAGTTAMLVHSDSLALAFLQHCQDAGLSIPEDMAVVSYDDEVAHLAEPAITAVRPPKSYVGKVAVEMIAARLAEGHRRPVHRINLNPELIIRASSVGGRRAAKGWGPRGEA
ncbi:DeoR faimly transcriptional regulator [Arthrobacter sp. ERGS1:01]|uniref:substrate-binding domain-containing protein n=1 Tax=Arthrobacter sp. ERGS1:01 TaxID=1704044 RepID=UPI0006B56ECE|nr:substrate-binding domain-containing protein [Arthrobacter sp. ERGS1:01]ALE07999.1 DeoR faimly transcriptional regulator [Arthrobacter sp. ERGS1:01]